ncbi:cysteine dioxygenase [Streptomyces longisporoflavus]|uniref:Cysteine dioxygenase n=1 Tax=Streptomyces longisporoflavus TaxID=28044 RepID=A0ABW7R2N4_9ACTN
MGGAASSPDCGEADTLLAALVAAVRESVSAETTATAKVARTCERLRPFLAEPGLLTAHQRRESAEGYRQHLLHAASDGLFSVVALVWRPGQRTPVHDHVSWCVSGLWEGREIEQRYRAVSCGDSRRLLATDRLVHEAGDVNGLVPPGDIHQVHNPGPGRAISIHVYGADISRPGSSVRRVYPEQMTGPLAPASAVTEPTSAR